MEDIYRLILNISPIKNILEYKLIDKTFNKVVNNILDEYKIDQKLIANYLSDDSDLRSKYFKLYC